MNTYTLSQRLRYRFDNIMARGVSAQIALLLIVTGIVVLVGAIIVAATSTQHNGGFWPTLWISLLHVVDNGNISNDTQNNHFYIFIMLLVTLAGLTVLAALFGIITNGIDAQMERLRRGRSVVIERGHTLILGWSPQVFPIISELMVANENQRRASVVVLSETDKPEMEDEIRVRVPQRGHTRVVCRTGNPLDLTDLEIANPQAARSIIVLPPEDGDPDTYVIKTLLAIAHHPRRRAEPYHIVAPIRDPRNLEVAQMAGKGEAQLVLGHDLMSRITVQTCRQSGLSVVYTELLDFDGDEMYFQEEPALVGKTFAEALMAYESSAVIGLHRADGAALLNPPMDTVIQAGDRIIAISEDDDTVVLSGRTDLGIDETAIRHAELPPPAPERTLIFNWNSRTPGILRELDEYVAPGSEACVVVRDRAALNGATAMIDDLKNLRVQLTEGDATEHSTLERLKVDRYDHVVVLGESDTLDVQEADARTLTTLLHLRRLQDRADHHFSVVSEMADIRNRELATATRADDFIVSDQLVSLMMSQLSENSALQPVFDDLFDPEGSEIYLKPADQYVATGQPLNFYTVVEAARRRGEVAIGYRLQRQAENPAEQYGVNVNPEKSASITFDTGDKVIVLAEN